MISKDCDIREFILAVEGKEEMEIIRMADLEATEAERCLYRSKTAHSEQADLSRAYAQHLKNLICFIRYGIRPSGPNARHANLFDSVCRSIPTDSRPCMRSVRSVH